MDGIFDCIVEENVTIEGFENMSVQFKDDGHERVDDSVESHVVFNDGSDGYFVNEEGIGVVLVDAEWEERNVEDNAHEEDEEVQKITINGFEDMKDMDLLAFSPHEIVKYEFANLEVATMFYTWYARVNGFAARKGKIITSRRTGRILQRNHFCYREGFRDESGVEDSEPQREPKARTRCGCKAEFRAHVDMNTGLWYCSYFFDKHNHELLDPRFCAMLPAHRRMAPADVNQMNTMLKVGIGPPQIFGAFANQSGGYEKIGFRKKDLYNQITQQRRLQQLDASSAVKYLCDLGLKDNSMFNRHTITEDGRLEHLFWSDGIMQLNYMVFGDVLAFDATYGKNKYKLPLVVFSGVNHHNRTTIFASAVVANETEETYVWLLRQFLEAMKGKMPSSVITDGDVAMKNAIKEVFPRDHHRLCAWHLARNATSSVAISAFTTEFESCMFATCDVGEFQRRWTEMVAKFGVGDKAWVRAMYEKRQMWVAAYMRGKFFAGFRTTSRCEGLHSELAKFVHSKHNICDFLQHFYQCVERMRFKEMEDDFASIHGDPVLQSSLVSIEESAAKVLTRQVFFLFRPVLDKASMLHVIGCKELYSVFIYTVCKKRGGGKEYNVSYNPCTSEFKCPCMWFESYGLPCAHIVVVLDHLNMKELPRSLVLKRWTKGAKDNVSTNNGEPSMCWDAQKFFRTDAMKELYWKMADLDAHSVDEFNVAREKALLELKSKEARRAAERAHASESRQGEHEFLRDLVRVRHKGSGVGSTSSTGLRVKRTTKCGYCRVAGHNRVTCPLRVQASQMSQSADERNDPGEEDDHWYSASFHDN